MMIALLKLLPWVLGGALVLNLHGNAASSHPAANEPPPPTDLLSKIDAAYKSADPTQLRAVADELEKRGFTAHAADLRKMAATIDAAVKRGVKAPDAPAVPADAGSRSIGWPALTPLPPLATQGPSAPPADKSQLLAGTVALHLKTARKGTEDQTLVTRFQQDNQPDAGKPDGMYGMKSALVLALRYGIVPPKPYYWRKPYSAMVADQKAYRGTMIAQATKDPQRSDEWMLAAKEITIGKA